MKRGLIFVFLILLIASIFSVNAAVDKTKAWHSSSEIIVSFGNCKVTLQDAIANGYFKGVTPTNCLSALPSVYHTADEIWISTDNGEMTLADALSQGVALKKNSFAGYSSSPTDKTKPYHFANGIELLLGKTFQDKINEGTLSCVSNYGQSCYLSGDTSCVNPGTIQCDGSCSGSSYKLKGTVCDTEKICDGSGVCSGIIDLTTKTPYYSGAKIESWYSCNIAFWNEENVKDTNDDTYCVVKTSSYMWSSYDPSCSWTLTASLPNQLSAYIRKIQFIIQASEWNKYYSEGTTSEIWLEYYDGSWHPLYYKKLLPGESTPKTTKTFYISNPITKISKMRIRGKYSRASEYQTINHANNIYAMRMYGIY